MESYLCSANCKITKLFCRFFGRFSLFLTFLRYKKKLFLEFNFKILTIMQWKKKWHRIKTVYRCVSKLRKLSTNITPTLTYNPFFLNIWIACLKSATFWTSPRSFGRFDGKLKTTGIDPRHFFILLSNRSLNVRQDFRCQGSIQTLKV